MTSTTNHLPPLSQRIESRGGLAARLKSREADYLIAGILLQLTEDHDMNIDDLKKLSLAELRDIYNKLTGAKVKRFDDRVAANRTVAEALKAQGQWKGDLPPGKPIAAAKADLTTVLAKNLPAATSGKAPAATKAARAAKTKASAKGATEKPAKRKMGAPKGVKRVGKPSEAIAPAKRELEKATRAVDKAKALAKEANLAAAKKGARAGKGTKLPAAIAKPPRVTTGKPKRGAPRLNKTYVALDTGKRMYGNGGRAQLYRAIAGYGDKGVTREALEAIYDDGSIVVKTTLDHLVRLGHVETRDTP